MTVGSLMTITCGTGSPDLICIWKPEQLASGNRSSADRKVSGPMALRTTASELSTQDTSGEGQARGHAQNARGESLDHEGSNRQLGYEEVTDAAGFDCIRCACTHAAE